MKRDLSKQGTYEPDGMIERHDLTCRGCGAFALEKPTDGTFRFSCATYWRGKHGTCWNCAAHEGRFLRAETTGQLDLFGAVA